MQPYRTIVTVDDPNQIILQNVPVQQGDRIEIVVRPCDQQRADRDAELQRLMRETQSLPKLQRLTEEELAVEIAAYRAGQ